jgi:hypothetical protein
MSTRAVELQHAIRRKLAIGLGFSAVATVLRAAASAWWRAKEALLGRPAKRHRFLSTDIAAGVPIPAAAKPRQRAWRGDEQAQVIREQGPAFAAPKRPIQRRHGADEAFILVATKVRSTSANKKESST